MGDWSHEPHEHECANDHLHSWIMQQLACAYVVQIVMPLRNYATFPWTRRHNEQLCWGRADASPEKHAMASLAGAHVPDVGHQCAAGPGA